MGGRVKGGEGQTGRGGNTTTGVTHGAVPPLTDELHKEGTSLWSCWSWDVIRASLGSDLQCHSAWCSMHLALTGHGKAVV